MDPIRTPVQAAPPRFQPPPSGPPESNNRSNALNIVDEFTPSPLAPVQLIPNPNGGPPLEVREAPHGTKVEIAARQTGFQGRINQIQTGANPLLDQQRMAEMELRFTGLTGEQARQAIDRYTQNQSMALMLGAGAELDTQTRAGTRQAVTNFSLGAGAATASGNLYDRARLGWTPPGPNEPPADDPSRLGSVELMNNLAAAFEVRPQDLTSSDPAVSGPARARLQQGLVDATARSANSPQVRQFQQGYAQTVSRYEAQQNSVVLSAGNEGDLLQRMQQDNGGTAITAPPDFFRSALATAETTSVGAMEFNPQRGPHVAAYSSGGSNVPIIAPGYAFDGQPGTSFASPQVAAVMQQIHRDNPTMSSAEVERRMLQLRTIPVEGTHALTM